MNYTIANVEKVVTCFSVVDEYTDKERSVERWFRTIPGELQVDYSTFQISTQQMYMNINFQYLNYSNLRLYNCQGNLICTIPSKEAFEAMFRIIRIFRI